MTEPSNVDNFYRDDGRNAEFVIAFMGAAFSGAIIGGGFVWWLCWMWWG